MSKHFTVGNKDIRALDGVSIHVNEGEIFGILGPNGAGKTTAMLIIGTLMRPSSGRVVVAGVDVDEDAPAARRRLSVVLQETGLDPLQTGREILEMHAQLWGASRHDARTRARDLLDLVDLGDAADRRIKTYSGGMRRRLDLATALVHRAPVVVLDEPTTGLDVASRHALWAEIGRAPEHGSTVVFTTQNLDEAERLSDRVGILGHGRVLGIGTPRQFTTELGAPKVTLEVATPEGARRAAATIPAARVDGLVVTLALPEAEHRLPGLLRELDGAGVEVSAVRVDHPSLEDAFVSLTTSPAAPAEPTAP